MNPAKDELMDTAYLSALAALAGSAVGGLTSLTASWLSQQRQAMAQELANDKSRRQELYRDFIIVASRLHGDSLIHDNAEVPNLVEMYALISRMRILCFPTVVSAAEQVARTIIDTYSAPNRTFPELREMMNKGEQLDPLRQFAEVCREDLQILGSLQSVRRPEHMVSRAPELRWLRPASRSKTSA